ncbi:hypothetical protein C8R31_10649 [Nitrosospira sp. Nsp2]|nr:hypothetical protein C8R31_10649 [Nitrosospira sp. Nsp2]
MSLFQMSVPLFLSNALATYNGERYISEQLRSTACRTRLPDELVDLVANWHYFIPGCIANTTGCLSPAQL